MDGSRPKAPTSGGKPEGRSVASPAIIGWAVHPGVPALLDVIEERLELADGKLRESRAVLAEHGNCFSPTVLLVLDRIRQEGKLRDGDPVVAMAFGPGLTLYATLLPATTAPR